MTEAEEFEGGGVDEVVDEGGAGLDVGSKREGARGVVTVEAGELQEGGGGALMNV